MKKPRINADSINSRLDPKTIESVWADHLAQCQHRCGLVILEQPATLRECCPEGSQYIKVLLEKRAAPEIAAKKKADDLRGKEMRGEFYASKKKVRELTKFK